MNRTRTLLHNASTINCNTLVAFEPENVFYATGFWGEAIAIVNGDEVKLIAPRLEADRASKGTGCQVIPAERGSSMIEILLSNLGNDGICTDCNDTSVYEKIKKERSSLLHSMEPFYQSRKIKDGNEKKIIADSCRILDKLFRLCEKIIKPADTETSIQARLLFEAMKMEAYPPSYKYSLSPLIIASGPNSALPHAEPTGRKIRKGDFVTIDLTLRHNGYIADVTRTFAVGKITSEMRKVYDIVKEAHEAGIDAAKDGAQCGEVDDECRSHIEKKGYGKYFIHSTGHGIGLEVHEPPWLRAKNQDVLLKNMAVTIEPGIYLPNKFGVRIEDSLLVDRKAKSLNHFSTELIAI